MTADPTAAAPSAQPLSDFSHCHAGITAKLQALAGLPALLAPAAQARHLAADSLAFFAEVIEAHHSSEETASTWLRWPSPCTCGTPCPKRCSAGATGSDAPPAVPSAVVTGAASCQGCVAWGPGSGRGAGAERSAAVLAAAAVRRR